VDRANPS